MFWWKFDFSSNFGWILQKPKQVDRACYSVEMRSPAPVQRGRRAGRHRLRARCHAPSHAAAWLREPRREVDEPTACSSPPLSDYTAQPPRFSFFNSTPTSLLRLWISPHLLPFQATWAHQQLHQDPSNRLRPLSQALTPCSSQPNRSSPIPVETLPWTPHRGQACSEPLYCRRLLRWSHGEPPLLMRSSVRVLLARSGRRLSGRGGRPPCIWPWGARLRESEC